MALKAKNEKRLFYGNIHAEDFVGKSNPDWAEDFLKEFATYQVPYHFLNQHKRLAIVGHGQSQYCEFADGIRTYRKHRRITQNGETLKNEDDLFLPYVHEKNSYFAYSRNGFSGFTPISTEKGTASVFEITPDFCGSWVLSR